MKSEHKIPVILVTNSLAYGGSERDLKTLGHRLPETYAPEIWSFLPPEVGDTIDVPVRVFSRFIKLDPLLVLRLAWILARHPAKTVHIFHFAFGIHILLANLLLLGRKRLIFTFGSGRYLISKPVFRVYAWLVNRFAAAITSNSHATSNDLVRDGISGNRIVIVPNGHDASQYKRVRPEHETGISSQPSSRHFGLVTTGRLVASKRVIDLLEAVKLLNQRTTKWDLHIVGDGPERKNLEQFSIQNGLASQIHFAGTRPHKDVLEFLFVADVFVFPSESEGLPNSVIEACLAGLPIVACDIPGVCDAVEHGSTAILVPCRDPKGIAAGIEQLFDDASLRTSLGNKAREQALARFSLDTMISGYVYLYSSVGK